MFLFYPEGPVCIKLDNKKLVERYLYLFSNMLLVCKKMIRKTGMGGNQASELKLKLRITLDQFHICDDVDDQMGEMEHPFSFSLEYLEKEGKQSNSTGSSPSQSRSDKSRLFGIRENKSLAGSTQTLSSMHVRLPIRYQ